MMSGLIFAEIKKVIMAPVMKVMATINAAGFTNIGLVTDPLSQ